MNKTDTQSATCCGRNM